MQNFQNLPNFYKTENTDYASFVMAPDADYAVKTQNLVLRLPMVLRICRILNFFEKFVKMSWILQNSSAIFGHRKQIIIIIIIV